MLPLVLMAAGTALQVVGQYQANQAQARAELQNAAFYAEQATFARTSMFRELDIASRRYGALQGAQLGAYAKGNVDISGSAAGIIAETAASKIDELAAIKYKGEMDWKLATLRSRRAEETAAELSSFQHNLLQAGGSILGGAAKATDSNASSPASQAFGGSTYGQNAPSFSQASASTTTGHYLGTYNFNY